MGHQLPLAPASAPIAPVKRPVACHAGVSVATTDQKVQVSNPAGRALCKPPVIRQFVFQDSLYYLRVDLYPHGVLASVL